jgi:excisionase family DNA binding protein
MAATKSVGAVESFDLDGGTTRSKLKEAVRGKQRARAAAERYLTRGDVAERLQVSIKTIDRWIKSGELPAAKLGGLVRISERDLAVLLAKSRSGAW